MALCFYLCLLVIPPFKQIKSNKSSKKKKTFLFLASWISKKRRNFPPSNQLKVSFEDKCPIWESSLGDSSVASKLRNSKKVKYLEHQTRSHRLGRMTWGKNFPLISVLKVTHLGDAEQNILLLFAAEMAWHAGRSWLHAPTHSPVHPCPGSSPAGRRRVCGYHQSRRKWSDGHQLS